MEMTAEITTGQRRGTGQLRSLLWRYGSIARILALAALSGIGFFQPHLAQSEGLVHVHFDLPYSADDSLCRPIAQIYNDDLHKLIVHNDIRKKRRRYSYGSSFPTEFLMSDIDAFAKAGLVQAHILSGYGGYVSNIFIPEINENRPVLFQNYVPIPMYSAEVDTSMTVLKANTTVEEMQKLTAPIDLGESAHSKTMTSVYDNASDNEATKSFLVYLSSDEYYEKHVKDEWDIQSKKMMAKLYKKLTITEKQNAERSPTRIPGLGWVIFRRQNRQILVADSPGDFIARSPRAVVLVSDISDTKNKLLCVLWMDPTHSLVWHNTP